MEKIIVIDTETVTGTYGLLSVGAVVLERDGDAVATLDTYFGFSDEYEYGFYVAQQIAYARRNKVKRKPRFMIEAELADMVLRHDVHTAFAYNAKFDKAVSRLYLPSLDFTWLDLMKPARRILASDEHYPAYKRLHPYIELTKGGVLKRGYSVECIGRYLGLPHETHVAIEDAQMETEIALRLGLFDCAAVC
jgi:DNA polymerase III epsilon subunit-like protein